MLLFIIINIVCFFIFKYALTEKKNVLAVLQHSLNILLLNACRMMTPSHACLYLTKRSLLRETLPI